MRQWSEQMLWEDIIRDYSNLLNLILAQPSCVGGLGFLNFCFNQMIYFPFQTRSCSLELNDLNEIIRDALEFIFKVY